LTYNFNLSLFDYEVDADPKEAAIIPVNLSYKKIYLKWNKIYHL
jgi:hypothetical protein